MKIDLPSVRESDFGDQWPLGLTLGLCGQSLSIGRRRFATNDNRFSVSTTGPLCVDRAQVEIGQRG